MLTFDDATKIVHASVGKVSNRTGISEDDRLQDLGIDSDHIIASLIKTIADDPDVGVRSIWCDLEPRRLADINPSLTIGDLVKGLQVSARKLCSNPSTPHPQPYPYPPKCVVCLYPVIK